MPKGTIVPVTQEQVVAAKLRNLHDRLRLTRQAMRSPTMPIYGDFPGEAVDGQHVMRGGSVTPHSPYFFWNDRWHPLPIYVGTDDGPPFESPWSGTVWFEFDWNHNTVIGGAPTGGSPGDTVFFLPAAYRPAEDVEDVCRGENLGDISFWTVQASDGAVIYEGTGHVLISGLDGGSP